MAPLIVAYDAECALCRQLMAWLQRRDQRGLLVPFPLQHPNLVAMAPELAGRPLQATLHVLDSGTREVRAGGAALAPLLARLPRWGWAAFVLRLPGISTLAQVGYRWLAARRGCQHRPRRED